MLKKLTLIASLLALMLLAGSSFVVAQDLQILNENGEKTNAFELISSTKSNTSLNFQLNSYWLEEVQTPNGAEKIVNAMESARILQAGAPDLPLFSASLIIPDQGRMEVKIVNSTYKDIENVSIAPSKGNLTRDINPADVEYKYGKAYKKDAFFPGKLAQLNKPYIVRDFRGEALWVYPFQYNPATKTLRVYTSIELEVVATDQQGENEFTRTRELTNIDREFHHIYNRQFINYDNSKYDPVAEDGTMLIICYDDWTAEMQPLVDWKNLIGRPTEMVTVTEAGGTAAAIGSYVADYYTNNGLTHLLLVGDAAQVPTNSGGGLGGDSDNAYAYVTGDDHYVEFFVGRFSAETAADVTTQVERTIAYEDGSTLSSGWLTTSMGVTSEDGTGGDDGEEDFEHYRNMATDLLGFSYTESLEFFDGSQGGDDAAGNPTAAMVGDAINAGAGIINYTGHGSDNSWVSSGFNNSDIDALTNDNMLPFIWSVACVNGNFVSTTCFGEAWMRATNGDNPTGAIAIFASTINQSWNPPMAGQDEMVDILVESYANNIKRTYGGLSFNGCHLMNDEYSDFAMTDTWTIFGDPSLLVRTEDPTALVASYPAALLIGQGSFNVTCGTEDALVCLTIDGEILATAPVSGGSANLTFTAPTTPGEMKVTITGFNKITHHGLVDITPADEPYVILNEYNVNGNTAFGESVTVDLNLKNVTETGSGFDAANVDITVTTEDAYVTITDATESFGTIVAGDSTTIADAIAITFADDIPDQHSVMFTLTATGVDAPKYTWVSSFSIVVDAPALSVGGMSIDDTGSGNGDYILDPGETANLILTINNDGAADITNVNSTFAINTGAEYLSFTSNSAVVGAIAAGANATATFEVTADAETPLGTPVDMTNNVTGGATDQYTATADKQVIIGFVPEYCESGATNEGDTEIDEVVFGDVTNNTAGVCATYSDFTEDPTLTDQFMIGQSFDISVTLGTCSGDYTKAAKVYIDWNYDGDFEDANEMVFETPATSPTATFTETITVPADAPAGQKFMRIVASEDESNISPCGTFSYGETEDYKITLVAPNPPVADFSATPTATTVGMNVAFTDLTTNAPSSWAWTITPGAEGTDFAYVNGTDNTSQNPVVQFNTANVYSVELTATNLVDSDTQTKADYITISSVTEAPVANFSADVTEIYPGEVVHFTDLSTNTPTGWQWNVTPGAEGTEFAFVETTTSTSQNPAIQFNNPGNYTIELVASNEIGDSDPYSVTDMVYVMPVFYMQDGSVTTCTGTFFDTGGPDGDYGASEDYTFTIYPSEAGMMTKVEFIEFATENNSYSGGCYDELSVYDGENTSGTLIGSYCNTQEPPTFITSTDATGALTFVFTSDGSVQKAGWEAEISCVSDEVYMVTFEVTEGTTPMEGATITCPGMNPMTTDVTGTAVAEMHTGTHEYTVSMSGYDDVTGTFEVVDGPVTVPVNMLGIGNVQTANLKLYPNPTNGNVTVELPHMVSGATAIVTDLTGKTIATKQFESTTTTVDLSNVSEGIYIIRVQNGNTLHTNKIIVK
jgi:PKD repeat protein